MATSMCAETKSATRFRLVRQTAFGQSVRMSLGGAFGVLDRVHGDKLGVPALLAGQEIG
jgi:hypothetical protein